MGVPAALSARTGGGSGAGDLAMFVALNERIYSSVARGLATAEGVYPLPALAGSI